MLLSRFLFILLAYSVIGQDTEIIKNRLLRVDNWIIGEDIDLLDRTYITLNCGEAQITVVCRAQRASCGPKSVSLSDFYKKECRPLLEQFYQIETKKQKKRTRKAKRA